MSGCTKILHSFVLVALLLAVVSCNAVEPTPAATVTAIPPTATATASAIPPTATATAVPPTATTTAAATAVPPTATPTATAIPPTATPTAVPPTPTRQSPLRGSVAEGIVVNWLGTRKGCTVTGPTEVAPGEVTVVVENWSREANLFVTYIGDYSYEDLPALQGRPGKYWKKPPWMEFARAVDGWQDEVRKEVVRTYAVDREAEMMIGVYTVVDGRPLSTWICGPLTVTGAPAE